MLILATRKATLKPDEYIEIKAVLGAKLKAYLQAIASFLAKLETPAEPTKPKAPEAPEASETTAKSTAKPKTPAKPEGTEAVARPDPPAYLRRTKLVIFKQLSKQTLKQPYKQGSAAKLPLLLIYRSPLLRTKVIGVR